MYIMKSRSGNEKALSFTDREILGIWCISLIRAVTLLNLGEH